MAVYRVYEKTPRGKWVADKFWKEREKQGKGLHTKKEASEALAFAKIFGSKIKIQKIKK